MKKTMSTASWSAVGDFVWHCFYDASLYNEPHPITRTDAAQQVAAMRADGWDLPDALDADSFCYWWNTLCESCYIER